MVDRLKPPFFRRFFASRLFLAVGFVCVLLLGLANARVYYHGYKIQQEIRAMQMEIETLNQKKLESMEVLKYVMSDAFVEDTARTELNMKKPGERVAVITGIEDPRTAEPAAQNQDDAGQAMKNPVKWWYYFFGAVD